MTLSNEKIKKLIEISELYYNQNKKQSEIAKIMGVSRPLISRMLQYAREQGIVEIKILNQSTNEELSILEQATKIFGIKSGILVQEGSSNNATNELLAKSTMQCIRNLGGGHIGLGWGHIIGVIVSILEKQLPTLDVIEDVCPMVGNSSISIRNYHSNENVRIVAHHTKSKPFYLYTPDFAQTEQELMLMQQTESYKVILEKWQQLDIAVVNIGNYPSTPDFASGARYGDLLSKEKAVGKMIAYYFNEQGNIIHSDDDYAIQIPIQLLTNAKNVVGVCSANVSKFSLLGALRTGIFTHIITREQLMKEVLNIK